MLQCFERSNAVEIHNGVTFDFYAGLPHIGYIPALGTWDVLHSGIMCEGVELPTLFGHGLKRVILRRMGSCWWAHES